MPQKGYSLFSAWEKLEIRILWSKSTTKCSWNGYIVWRIRPTQSHHPIIQLLSKLKPIHPSRTINELLNDTIMFKRCKFIYQSYRQASKAISTTFWLTQEETFSMSHILYLSLIMNWDCQSLLIFLITCWRIDMRSFSSSNNWLNQVRKYNSTISKRRTCWTCFTKIHRTE